MNTPLKALQSGAIADVAGKSARIVPIKLAVYATGNPALSTPAGDFGLAGFRLDAGNGERGLLDYLLIGLLTLLAHAYIVQGFHDASSQEQPVTPVKVPPMVQITLTPPPPQPIVQPPPPPPPPPPKKVEPPPPKKDVVALKPQKVKPKPPPPKPVVERVEPRPQTPVVDDPPPAPVRAAEPAPPAPVVEKVTPPSGSAGYLHNPAPAYPEMAEEEGWQGRVVLKVHVLANGKPDAVSVQKSSGHDVLDQAAVRTVKASWHFAPAMRGDTPTDGWVSVPIVFNLPG